MSPGHTGLVSRWFFFVALWSCQLDRSYLRQLLHRELHDATLGVALLFRRQLADACVGLFGMLMHSAARQLGTIITNFLVILVLRQAWVSYKVS